MPVYPELQTIICVDWSKGLGCVWNKTKLPADCVVTSLTCLTLGMLLKHINLVKPTRAICHSCFASIDP